MQRIMCVREPKRSDRQAFLSTIFGLALVDDVVAAAWVVDEPPALDPDEDGCPPLCSPATGAELPGPDELLVGGGTV